MGLLLRLRLKDARLPPIFSPHSFRVLVVTDLLSKDVPLEDVQNLGGHANPKTTQSCDRRQRRITRNIVERISVQTLRIRRVLAKSILLVQWRDLFYGEKTIYCTRE